MFETSDIVQRPCHTFYIPIIMCWVGVLCSEHYISYVPHCRRLHSIYCQVNFRSVTIQWKILKDTSEIRTPWLIRTLDWVPSIYLFSPWNIDTLVTILVPRVSLLERFHRISVFTKHWSGPVGILQISWHTKQNTIHSWQSRALLTVSTEFIPNIPGLFL